MSDNTDYPLLNITVSSPMSIPPSMDAKEFQFFGDLAETPLQNKPCYNCGSQRHQSKECKKPSRNESFKSAAMRVKGMIRDEAQKVPKEKVKEVNASLKTESVVAVREIKEVIKVKKRHRLLG